jgi:hypothetical protein
MRYGTHRLIYCIIVRPQEKISLEEKVKLSLQMSETKHKEIIIA